MGLEPNTDIRLVALLPFSMAAIFLFLSVITTCFIINDQKFHDNILVTYLLSCFVLTAFFLSRGILFAIPESRIEEDNKIILLVDRLIRSLPLLAVVINISFVRFFLKKQVETWDKWFYYLVVGVTVFLTFVTLTTDEVLITPITPTGEFGVARSTDVESLSGFLYFPVGVISMLWILWEFLHYFRHRLSSGDRTPNWKPTILLFGYLALFLGTGYEVYYLWFTSAGKDVPLYEIITMDVGGFIFVLLTTYVIIDYRLTVLRQD